MLETSLGEQLLEAGTSREAVYKLSEKQCMSSQQASHNVTDVIIFHDGD